MRYTLRNASRIFLETFASFFPMWRIDAFELSERGSWNFSQVVPQDNMRVWTSVWAADIGPDSHVIFHSQAKHNPCLCTVPVSHRKKTENDPWETPLYSAELLRTKPTMPPEADSVGNLQAATISCNLSQLSMSKHDRQSLIPVHHLTRELWPCSD